ncbi:hypothetical protein AAG570_000771 [Ranatra chinensis]|uniref:Uncharacterized protein n=1 Tax=Ranatra chinensis TaxID=642074 RepID=A0ABD0ZJ97_9HEMI
MFDLERMEEPQSDEDDPYWLAESDLENEEEFQRSEIALLKIPTSSLERDRAALFSGCRDIASWLSPEQQGHEELEPPSTVFLRDTVPSGRAYARALETIYKGFQSYLILLVKFLNGIPSVEQAFRIS